MIRSVLGWKCSCPDAIYRKVECEQVIAVQLSLKMRSEVEYHVLAPINATDACLFCGSKHIRRDGVRHNKAGDIQKFECLECKRYFTINLGFERMKHSPQGVTMAMQLFFSGESSRNTEPTLAR